jgi:DNA helicase HerA-like ATPase
VRVNLISSQHLKGSIQTRSMIGKVISSSTDRIYFRIDEGEEFEHVSIGTLIVIESHYTYLGRINELEARHLGESVLPDKIAALSYPDALPHIEGLFGPQFYYTATASLLGIIDGTRIKGAKSLPKYLAPVRRVTEADLKFLYKTDANISIGKVRDMDIPIFLDVDTFVTKHAGVFGKTGSGKSNCVKVIIKEVKNRNIATVVFDIHSEYGYHPQGLGGLKNVYVLGLKGAECDVSLCIPRVLINPSELAVITELTSAQQDALDLICHRERDWLHYIAVKDTEEISEDFEQRIRLETISTLKRKVARITNYEFVGEQFDSLTYIMGKVNQGACVIIDFGEYENNDWVIRLVTSIVARYLLTQFRSARRKNTVLPKTMIVLEESHKLLNKDMARQTVFERIVREGRKFNLGLCVVDQMPKKILDEVISQLNTVIILLLTNIKDREHLISSSENDLTDFKEEMRRLDIGEAIVTGIAVPVPIPAQIDLYTREDLEKSEKKDDFREFDWN